MRIRGGSGRVMVEVPKKVKKPKKPQPKVDAYFQDGFDVAPVKHVPSKHAKAATQAVVKDLSTQGKARVKEDEQRDADQLKELGKLMGALTGDLVSEVINHFVQRPEGQRTAAMVVLGALTGALLVEFWGVLKGDDAGLEQANPIEVLDQFVSFIEDTEGQPARRLTGTLYAL